MIKLNPIKNLKMLNQNFFLIFFMFETTFKISLVNFSSEVQLKSGTWILSSGPGYTRILQLKVKFRRRQILDARSKYISIACN